MLRSSYSLFFALCHEMLIGIMVSLFGAVVAVVGHTSFSYFGNLFVLWGTLL